MKLIELRPPRIAMVLTGFAALMSRLIGSGVRLSVPWLGVVLGVTGLVVMLWPWWLFRKEGLPICPTADTAHINTRGPYRLSRHPMYAGMVLMMAGIAVHVGTIPFYLSAVVYFAILNFVFCPFEENKLTIAFGESYTDYMKRVGRWL